jgi:predicted phage terminase large subunit-like protein
VTSLDLLYAERDRRQAEDDSEALTHTFRDFIEPAWRVLKPEEKFKANWHIDAICDHLQAVTRKDIQRLQIWIPRGMMKSLTVSVLWPAWEWTTDPWLRYWTASYDLGLAKKHAGDSLYVMRSAWYQARWGHRFQFTKTMVGDFENNKGGTRLATAPNSAALGRHGHRILIDDPIDWQAADATSRLVLDATNTWYDATAQGSKADPSQAAEVIIMQRLHEDDLAAHAHRQQPEEWTVLCLPERYETGHPFAWRADPRSEDDLLWPEYRPQKESDRMRASLGAHKASGQMQQRPSAREGELLKRYWWRFYDPRLFTDGRMEKRRPRFTTVVQSIDTPQKDKQTSDQIAIQAWGVARGDRYLLDLRVGKMNYAQARRALLEQAAYVRKQWRHAAHHVLIENAGYGVELIEELKRELTGIHKLSRAKEGDKELRAEAAAADLEGGNCFLPGYRMGTDELSMPDEARTPADVLGFIDECAMFPNGRYDDQVDAWSTAMNWLRARPAGRTRTWSSFKAKK